MKILSILSKSVNRLLSPLGIAVGRVEKAPWFQSTLVATPVGRYVIDIPGRSPLCSCYLNRPGFGLQLGRLVSEVRRKYPNLKVIDVGANVGDSACIIKSAEDVPVLCIEGDDSIFEILKRNLQSLTNTAAHKFFLGEKNEVLSAHFDKAGWNGTILPDTTGSAPGITITKLDDFIVTQPGWSDYKLLKTDAEGFDCRIIRGGRDFIRQVKPVITLEYNRENMGAIGDNGLDTLSMLAELGYSDVVFHDNTGRLLCATKLSDFALVKDLHEYADGDKAEIYYYDITLFDQNDSDVAQTFVAAERQYRGDA